MSIGAAAHHAGIVGRAAVLEACGTALDRALQGSGGLLLLAGEPGIGKTSVLQAASALAGDRRCIVAWAGCPEDDAVPAFWPVVRLLSEIGHRLTVAAAEELRGGDPEAAGQHRFVLFDRVAEALRQAAADRPLVLVLDDLHWADPSSLRLLAFLVKQIRTAPVLVMGSFRDTDVGPGHPLLELLSEPGTSGETLTLSGLGADDVATLVARAGANGAVAAAGHIRDHTGGNPFFVLHVARLLDAEGHSDGRGASLPLPVGVRAGLERRLARLPQACSELLGTAAVVGSRFDLQLLAEVSGTDPATVSDLLSAATAARLTQPAGDGAAHEFAHALVRATVSGQSSAARTAEIHGRVADSLVRRPGDPELRLAAIAHHELNAGAERAATRAEPRVCAQAFAGLASLGIGIHVAHELISAEPTSAAEVAAVVVAAGAVVSLAVAWYRLGRTPRRVLAVVLGTFWAVAASEHAVATVTGGTALDLTGVLAVVGGLLLAFAAYWDFHRPLERSL